MLTWFDRTRSTEFANDRVESQRPRHVELELTNVEPFPRVRATRLPGTPCPGFLLLLHHVTEMLRLESMRHEFVSNVSDELKTLFGSIKAYAERRVHGAIHDPENKVRFGRRIEEQLERLDQRIHDVLFLAPIESGKQTFELTDVRIGDVVDGYLADCLCIVESRQFEIVREENQPELQV